MKCPECNAWTDVLETRKRPAGAYRRYECANLHRFSTIGNEVVRVDKQKLGAGRPLMNVKL